MAKVLPNPLEPFHPDNWHLLAAEPDDWHLYTPEPAPLEIREGEAADRRRHATYLECAARPIGPHELQALLQRKGARPPPGIPRPPLFALMLTERKQGVIVREVWPIKKSQWKRFTEAAHFGRMIHYEPSHERACGYLPVYRDTIPFNSPEAE